VIGSLPHFPSAAEGIPGVLSGGAVEEAVLGRLEGSHFAGTGVVPDPSDNLGGCRVAETQTLDEVDDSRGGVWFPCVLVSSLGGVAEEGGDSQVVFLLLMPVTWIPIEIGDEAGSENPV
jgi:hypothetical protein